MKRSLILPLILIALASQQLTAETSKSVAQSSPEGLVSELYKLHEKNQSPFFQTKDHSMVTQYFAERLAQLIWKDAVSSKGEVGALDFDPLYDAQDFDIKKFSLRKSKSEKDSTEVIASFETWATKLKSPFLLFLQKRVGKFRTSSMRTGGIWLVS
jgi:ABC-type transporter MlaC component